MANSYWNHVVAFIFGSRARSSSLNTKMDGIADGFSGVETDMDKAIQVVTNPGVTDISENAASRASKTVGFDSSGDVFLFDDTTSSTLAAAASATLAEGYATTPEDTPVPGGSGFSALHWAQKSINQAKGIFVNNANDNPNISDTAYDLSLHPFASWSGIGNTTSGAANTWAALDSVPSDADWIEVGINVHMSSGAGVEATLSFLAHARKGGGSEAVTISNKISDVRQDLVNNTVAIALYSYNVVKIPISLTTGIFELYQVKGGTFGSNSSGLILKGYGWNS